MTETTLAAETAARASYGKLIAFLSARGGNITAAEDALSGAFSRALTEWETKGVPDRPEAWLLTVARRLMIDAARRQSKEQMLVNESESGDMLLGTDVSHEVPDRRLDLMFVCAHPAIDPSVHTPLMLQTVLGIPVKDIAAAMLQPAATLGQRLVRAKRKIKAAGLPFEVPAKDHWPERLRPVLEAVYAAYAISWPRMTDDISSPTSLAGEALFLSKMLAELTEGDPEALGLFALISFIESRRHARLDDDGHFIPLGEQNPHDWDHERIGAAQMALAQASQTRRLGRFQLEAAIQSVHAHRKVSGTTDWHTIVMLYRTLCDLAPSIGAHVALATAICEDGSPQEAQKMLEDIAQAHMADFDGYWAAMGHVLEKMNERERASDAFLEASALAKDDASQAYLRRRADALRSET